MRGRPSRVAPARPVTLPYVDTHCHLDLIFEKMNARTVSAKKKDKSGMPPPGAVHHATWLRAVRDFESDCVLTSDGLFFSQGEEMESTGVRFGW